MLVVDDLLIRPFVSIFQVLHSTAISELYDRESIRNDIKENRLLYELGELTESEYEERRADLETQLEIAEEAHERVGDRVVVMR